MICGRVLAAFLALGVASADFDCMGYTGGTPITCTDDTTCCGEGEAMEPTCVAAGKDQKCCTHHMAALTCGANEVCCGGGHAAGSNVFCCAEGTECCTLDYWGYENYCAKPGECTASVLA